MLWLIASLIVLQAAIHWLFEPVVQLFTPLIELDGLPWIGIFVGLWLFTGRSNR